MDAIPATDPSAPTDRRWIVFALAGLTSFMLYLHRYTWNLIRPELEAQYGFTNSQLGDLESAFYLTYAIGQIPSGVACDLFGPHLFLGAIIIIWSLSLPLHATGSVYGLGAVRLLFGAAQAGGYPALGSVTRNWFPLRNRTFVQGWVASFFGRGGGAMSSVIMGTLLMGFLGLSWQTALVIMAIPGVLFGAAFLAVYRNTPEEDPRANEAERELIRGDERPGGERRGVMPFGKALRNLSLQILVVQQFMNAGADVVYTLVMGSFFKSLGVADMEDLGWMVSLPLIGGALGGIAGGFLNDWLIRRLGSRRWGRSVIGFSGKILAAISLFVAISQPSAAAVAWGLFVVKFFSDWTQPTVWGTCSDLGGKYAATVFSINNMSGNIGAIVTPLIYGRLLDHFMTQQTVDGETQPVTNFTPMFVLVGAMYVGAAVCWLFIDCTRRVEDAREETNTQPNGMERG